MAYSTKAAGDFFIRYGIEISQVSIKMSKTKKTTWRDVKEVMSKKDKGELLKLVGDLYSLNKDNKVFIHSRFRIGKEQLEPYKKVISEAIYPDIYKNKSIKLSAGKKAISEYRKATKDTIGSIELMVHYLECGNQFTVNSGDIDEQFYSSLASMFKSILHALIKEPSEVQEHYFSRLERVVDSASDIGWGYYDYISDLLEEYFPDKGT